MKRYIQITGFIFFLVGLVHLIRLFLGWSIVINSITIPLWISVFGVLIPWLLAYTAWNLCGKLKK